MVIRFAIFFTVAMLLGPAWQVSAQAQRPLAVVEEEIDLLEQEIADLELFIQMMTAADYIPKQSRCIHYLDMAAGSRDELKALNEQYAGRADSSYRKRAQELLEENRLALEEYQSCFGSVAAQRYDKIRAANVSAYDPFRARYNQLSDWFGENSNHEARLRDMNKELAQLYLEKSQRTPTSDDPDAVAVVGFVANTVQVFRRGTIIPLEPDDPIFRGDRVITGQDGRVRINFRTGPRTNDVYANAHIGPDSEFVVEQHQQRLEASREQGVVDLIRGTIRIVVNPILSSGRIFSIRAGTTVCGIRGTEILIEYNDQTGTARHWLLNGKADLDLGSATRSLKPMNMVETPRQGPIQERPFSAFEYDALSTGDAPPNRDADQLAQAEQSAEFHVRRMMDEYVRGDLWTAVAYFYEDDREEALAILNQPGGQEELLRTAEVPIEWEFGCVTCETADLCRARLRIRTSSYPDDDNYMQWVLRPREGLWVPVDSTDIEIEEYQRPSMTCGG